MQIDFIADGWYKDLDYMEDCLKNLIMPMPVVKDGKKIMIEVPAVLRPRRAYTLAFPRDQLGKVINTLNLSDHIAIVDGKGTRILTKTLNILRKMLKLKKIPKPNIDEGRFSMPSDAFENLRMVGIGYKDDIDFVNPAGITQEGI